MAFCTACGTTVSDQAKACPKCGAALASGFTPAAGAPGRAAAPAPPAPAATGGGGALKIVLIVIGVLILLAVLAMATVGYVAYRTARAMKQAAEGASVQTAMSEDDVKKLVADLGVDLYPGATYKRGGTSAGIGGMKVMAATFESSDPDSHVAEWYKSKYPGAMSADSPGGHSLSISRGQTFVTVAIKPVGGKTEIVISSLQGVKAPSVPQPPTTQ